ncbi:hypothetical protein [Nocardia sp. CY41]|uniref:hypothetical protein n=1 Tax=Nocardia sp. CY41 TaxID=2608686 RepID=UPI001F345199
MLSAVRFVGGTSATELLVAVDMLRKLNATGRRKVFDEAPTGFVPTKWRGYLEQARKTGNAVAAGIFGSCVCWSDCGTGYHRGRVRPRVAALRRPGAYLLTREQWEPQRAEFCRLVDQPDDPAHALAAIVDEWG